MEITRSINRFFIIVAIAIATITVASHAQIIEFENMYEAAMDIPKVSFLFRRCPTCAPLEYDGEFVSQYGYLDTGASGILLAKETAEAMGIALDENGVYVDAGVGGNEYFDISESLYLGIAPYSEENPNNYENYGPWHMQVSREYASPLTGQIDLMGIPVMASKTVIFNSGLTNNLEDFTAEIVDSDSNDIPAVDFEIPLRFKRYTTTNNPETVAPFPVLAYNPVIDNITIELGANSTSGTWLFDTGATLSLISTQAGIELGLVDSDGEPIVTPAFTAQVGGVGGTVNIPGFIVDSLEIPTISGYDLVFKNARIAVHDVAYYDWDTNQTVTLDGVFGSNFLCATMEISSYQIAATPFEHIVLDTDRGTLGFDVDPAYQLPPLSGVNDPNYSANCGSALMPYPACDFNRDCVVDVLDVIELAYEWLNDCGALDWNCANTDTNRDGITNNLDLH